MDSDSIRGGQESDILKRNREAVLKGDQGRCGREATVAVTIQTLMQRKQQGQPIVALTAWDFAIAQILDQSGVDLILVGGFHGHGRPGASDNPANYPG
ncbi:3-methyl-2-oxobutanoate hydroxymethyltransferase [Neosynechococcus sphagnicola]|uniref:3-methyl-2-oxobutanoate hydroxymethyltransferase n=1 Tax=Neosynechococcus sphagnicola TaxID=1501145 RepID=UPI0030846750